VPLHGTVGFFSPISFQPEFSTFSQTAPAAEIQKMTSESSGIATPSQRHWKFADFQTIQPVPCPCGLARRAFSGVPEFPGTLHITDISENAQRHYHRRLTETYVILECGPDAAMELDGELIAAAPFQSFVIPPGVRHRAVGRMKVLIVVLPDFDPADEWFD